jgi:sugar phosphate isomerase/epimerase
MSFLTLGVVSNCWSDLLKERPLAEMCRQAQAAGYGYVELRQRGMAECEERVPGDDRPWPLPDRLAELRHALPDLGMNLAVEAPFMTTPLAADDPYLMRCVSAAKALGGEPPVLRLVDLSPVTGLLPDEAAAALGEAIGVAAQAFWRDGVRLALENSKQPVGVLLEVARRAAAELPPEAAPQICWDPANQVQQQLSPEDPVRTAGEFRPGELFEFHFKQVRYGVVQPEVGEGQLDWSAILAAVRATEYRGPALFEIPSGPDIIDRLQRSIAYVRGVVGGPG